MKEKLFLIIYLATISIFGILSFTTNNQVIYGIFLTIGTIPLLIVLIALPSVLKEVFCDKDKGVK